MAFYETNFTIASTDGSEEIEIRNPNLSLKTLKLTRVGVVSETPFAVYQFNRYTSLATHNAGSVQQTVYKWNPASGAPACEVWVGPSGSITWNGSVDYAHDEQLDTSDAGDDAEWIPAKYLDQANQILLTSNNSFRMRLPAGAQATYTIKILWEE